MVDNMLLLFMYGHRQDRYTVMFRRLFFQWVIWFCGSEHALMPNGPRLL